MTTLSFLAMALRFSQMIRVFTAGRRPRCLGTASCQLVVVVVVVLDWDVTVGKM